MASSKKYGVSEIFGPTLQGEGSQSGTPCAFLRLAGCNMWSGKDEETRAKSKCPFCDTDFRLTERLSASTIANRIARQGVGLVVISGGEPMLQVDMELLIAIREKGITISIETNGTIEIPIEIRNLLDHVTLSPKVPPEGLKLRCCTDLKVLYPHPNPDIRPDEYYGWVTCEHRFIQPIAECQVFGDVSHETHYPELNADTIEKAIKYCYQHPEWRLSLQQHKIIGLD